MYYRSCLEDTWPVILEDAPPDPLPFPVLNSRPQDEVIVAWRVWKVAADFGVGSVSLQSVFLTNVWPAGAPMKACCAELPAGLRHGVNAFSDKSRAEAYFKDQQRCGNPPRVVFGEVSLWGRVIVHESGYRAQFAYPRRILVPFIDRDRDIVNGLRRAYGIDVEWLTL
jgi:hypothetical protein